MSKVSIIVPCWGVEKYLDRCVESLINQTMREMEIILVDDESPDRVPEMCDEWAKRDNRIKVIHKKNGGLGMACNSGLEVATGDYIAFCDSDDWMELDAYEKMYVTAISTGADAVYTGIQTIDEKGNICPMNHYDHFEILNEKEKIIGFAMDMICSRAEDPIESHIAMSAKIVLYRRALIEKYNLKFVSERQFITEDLIWNIDILGRASIIVTMPEVFYYYFNNLSSLTKKVRLDRFPFFVSNYNEISKRTTNLYFPHLVHERIDRMFIRYVRHQIGDVLMTHYPYKKRREVVNEMLVDETTVNVLSSFPLYKLTKQQQIVTWLMRHKCVFGLFLLFKIKR